MDPRRIPLSLLCAALPLLAQAPVPKVVGSVRDPLGLPLAGAVLSLKPQRSGKPQTVICASNGSFRIFCKVGDVFDIIAQVDGFRPLLLSAYAIEHSGQDLRLTLLPLAPEDAALRTSLEEKEDALRNYEEGRRRFNAGRFSEALPYLDRADGDFRKGRFTLEPARAPGPGNVDSVEKMLAIALARSGDARFWPRADALLETLLARNPLDQLLLGTRLDLAKARNDAPLADALSRRVDDPGIQADRFCRQALDAFNHGQPREARKALDAALVLDPDHAESRYLLGLVEALLHHPRQAAEAFAHYLRVAPEGPHAAAARAWLNKNPRHGTV